MKVCLDIFSPDRFHGNVCNKAFQIKNNLYFSKVANWWFCNGVSKLFTLASLANTESGKVLYRVLFVIVQRYGRRYTFAVVLRRYTISKIKDDH